MRSVTMVIVPYLLIGTYAGWMNHGTPGVGFTWASGGVVVGASAAGLLVQVIAGTGSPRALDPFVLPVALTLPLIFVAFGDAIGAVVWRVRGRVLPT